MFPVFLCESLQVGGVFRIHLVFYLWIVTKTEQNIKNREMFLIYWRTIILYEIIFLLSHITSIWTYECQIKVFVKRTHAYMVRSPWLLTDSAVSLHGLVKLLDLLYQMLLVFLCSSPCLMELLCAWIHFLISRIFIKLPPPLPPFFPSLNFSTNTL